MQAAVALLSSRCARWRSRRPPWGDAVAGAAGPAGWGVAPAARAFAKKATAASRASVRVWVYADAQAPRVYDAAGDGACRGVPTCRTRLRTRRGRWRRRARPPPSLWRVPPSAGAVDRLKQGLGDGVDRRRWRWRCRRRQQSCSCRISRRAPASSRPRRPRCGGRSARRRCRASTTAPPACGRDARRSGGPPRVRRRRQVGRRQRRRAGGVRARRGRRFAGCGRSWAPLLLAPPDERRRRRVERFVGAAAAALGQGTGFRPVLGSVR